MELFRVHAYAITPLRTDGDSGEAEVIGGAVPVKADLRDAIESNSKAARFEGRSSVDFRMNEETRENVVRSLVLDFAFGEPPTAASAGRKLAERLSSAMDRRSEPCLFVPTAMREGSKRRVTLWTFPKDRALQLSVGRDSSPSINVLTDVFSQESKLRKAALFEGVNSKGSFLRGTVLDFQASHQSLDVADFWIRRFLDCQMAIRDDTGSRMLAKIVRRVYERTTDVGDREQLYAAMLSMRSSPGKRISIKSFADRYLEGSVKDALIGAAESARALNSLFDFKRDVFDETIGFRIFELQTGVFVSSPLDQVGRSVTVTGSSKERRLRCEGEIVEEKVRSRHA